jgi:hypothetical protein
MDQRYDAAAQTISEAWSDLGEVVRRLATRLPLDDFETERTARILDRLSEELAEAAAMLRATR